MRRKNYSATAFVLTLIAIIAAGFYLLSTTNASASTFKVIHTFCKKRLCWDGEFPRGPLLIDSAGDLFGFVYGSAHKEGRIFEMVRQSGAKSWAYKVIYAFCHDKSCSDGADPDGKLIIDTNGNLYGTASFGGANCGGQFTQCGVVFELSPNKSGVQWNEKVLYAFCPQAGTCPDGAEPIGGLTYAGASAASLYDGISPLFGVTQFGGNADYRGGAAFELTKQGESWSESVLSSFDYGGFVNGGVTMDSGGNLYGTTDRTGPNRNGAVFELSPAGEAWNFTTLYRFCPKSRKCSDGVGPQGVLYLDGAGNLFGTTIVGGNQHDGCCGVAYKLVPNGTQSQYSVIYDFCSQYNCGDGAQPESSLIMDSAGTLYGTASTGGGNDIDPQDEGGGTVFSLNGSLNVLHSFCAKRDCTDGEYPEDGLTMDGAGNLFGVTPQGGKFGGGTIFEITP